MIKKMKLRPVYTMVLILVLAFALTACGTTKTPVDSATTTENNTPDMTIEDPNLQTSEPVDEETTEEDTTAGGVMINPEELFESKLTLIEDGDLLKVNFEFTNIGTNDLTLTYMSGQRFDYQILDAAGETVLTWSANKSFIEMISEVPMAAGETILYTDDFDYSDMMGGKIPAGNYTLKFSTSFSVDEEMITLEASEPLIIN